GQRPAEKVWGRRLPLLARSTLKPPPPPRQNAMLATQPGDPMPAAAEAARVELRPDPLGAIGLTILGMDRLDGLGQPGVLLCPPAGSAAPPCVVPAPGYAQHAAHRGQGVS